MLFLLVALAALPPLLAAPTTLSVCFSHGKLSLDCSSLPPSAVVASARWEDKSQVDGWGDLRLFGRQEFPMELQARAMGMLEGYLTQERIFESKTNMFAHAFGIGQPASPAVAKYYSDQLAFVRAHLVQNSTTFHPLASTVSPFPPNARFSLLEEEESQESQGGEKGETKFLSPLFGPLTIVMQQFDGLVEGYNLAAPAEQKMTELDLYIHNGAGDLEDLGSILPGISQHLTLSRRFEPDINMLDCSALVRVTTKGEIYAAHTTWRDYMNMAPRAYKYYYLNTNSSRQWAVSFSSTPGFLSSKDDFYIVESAWSSLVVMETTNAIFNTDKYKLISPQSLFTWQRTMVANLIASSTNKKGQSAGEKWVTAFGAKGLNSGTYNNQWMVLSLSEHRAYREKMAEMEAETPGSTLELPAVGPNTLWILEQMPGLIQSADVSAILANQSYWPSYNVPFFVEIYNESGYNTKNGTAYSYQECPRAQIFRERAPRVESVEDMQALMQYNDYQHDPLALGSPLNAISSRYDLVSDNPRPFGGIDSKVTSDALVADLSAHIISGPTQQQGAFAWSNFHGKAPVEHLGQNDRFNFPWVVVKEEME